MDRSSEEVKDELLYLVGKVQRLGMSFSSPTHFASWQERNDYEQRRGADRSSKVSEFTEAVESLRMMIGEVF